MEACLSGSALWSVHFVHINVCRCTYKMAVNNLYENGDEGVVDLLC